MNGFADAEHVDFNDEKAVLRAALENEIKGRELYIQYARTVRSDMAKMVFEHLASEELTHISDIKQFLETTGDFSGVDVEKLTSEDSVAHAKKIFGQMIEELHVRVEPSDDDNRSRDVAMEFEKNGYEYYRKGADSTNNEKLKAFLLWLMEQEQSHYMLIKNAFDYMTDPASWNAAEEHWLLEG
ncbi:MAG: ferritin family protein [Candidatus Aenigmarchaeota archaeon]|nr:ferritin family protein [Candidatus Aenigmarchaeota archaeon]